MPVNGIGGQAKPIAEHGARHAVDQAYLDLMPTIVRTHGARGPAFAHYLNPQKIAANCAGRCQYVARHRFICQLCDNCTAQQSLSM